MATIYANLIMAGVKTIDDVPLVIKPKVIEVLASRGYEDM